jgi:dCMP deaminase
VLVQNDRIVATGYNGSAAGKPGCLTDNACPRAHSDVMYGSSYDTGPGACIALHSEQNAILYSSFEERKGATMYVTSPPCDGCRRLIAGSGIKLVIFPEGEWRVK